MRSECKKCYAAYWRAWAAKNKDKSRANVKNYVDRKASIARRLKKEAICADCGVKYPWYVYDFDHRDGETKVDNVSRLHRSKGFNSAVLVAEIAKCDIVCANCHRVRTHKRRTSKSVQGA